MQQRENEHERQTATDIHTDTDTDTDIKMHWKHSTHLNTLKYLPAPPFCDALLWLVRFVFLILPKHMAERDSIHSME